MASELFPRWEEEDEPLECEHCHRVAPQDMFDICGADDDMVFCPHCGRQTDSAFGIEETIKRLQEAKR